MCVYFSRPFSDEHKTIYLYYSPRFGKNVAPNPISIYQKDRYYDSSSSAQPVNLLRYRIDK